LKESQVIVVVGRQTIFDDEFTPSWSVCPRSVERCRLVAAARRFSFGQLEDDTIVYTAGEGEDVFASKEAGVISELFLFDSGKRAEKRAESGESALGRP
jgi:hypothetical protein